jgi:hypothetical protein
MEQPANDPFTWADVMKTVDSEHEVSIWKTTMIPNGLTSTKYLERRAGPLGKSYAHARVETYRAACRKNQCPAEERTTNILAAVYKEALEEFIMQKKRMSN